MHAHIRTGLQFVLQLSYARLGVAVAKQVQDRVSGGFSLFVLVRLFEVRRASSDGLEGVDSAGKRARQSNGCASTSRSHDVERSDAAGGDRGHRGCRCGLSVIQWPESRVSKVC